MLCAQSVNSDTIAATYYTGTYHLDNTWGRSYLGLCNMYEAQNPVMELF